MFHGESLKDGVTYVMADPNQQLGSHYLGESGWTSLKNAKRFSAEEASKESDGPDSYLGWLSEETALSLED